MHIQINTTPFSTKKLPHMHLLSVIYFFYSKIFDKLYAISVLSAVINFFMLEILPNISLFKFVMCSQLHLLGETISPVVEHPTASRSSTKRMSTCWNL